MLTEKIFKDWVTFGVIVGLFVLTLFVLKPVIFSVIWGALLAYIFYPVYKWVLKIIKNENISAFSVCFILFLIILIPIVLIINSLIDQVIELYLVLQNINLLNIFEKAIPSIFSSELSQTLLSSINSLIPKILSYFITKFSDFVLNLPLILLQLFVVIFVFFFGLKDGKKAVEYIQSSSPFTREISNKFFKQFKDITNSVLIGQVVVGILQGIAAGVGYYLFGVPNVMLLTLLTVLVSIIPLIGPWLVWVPADLYLFSSGETGAGIGLLIYGTLFVSLLDNLLRPLIVSKRTEINSAIVVVGMIGGLLMFGILGIIIGPLILGYILLIIDLYKEKKLVESPFLKEVKEEKPV
ncbi:MAG: AI-2E family transporter [Candidatus Nanoarchaeia archaeon]|nr:AI-2E family transporter [Candidatus Nanoarchaeia archaeon]MDD5740835.1 AI-2E family transporter [Candidatus Nanoarchaeia archaeon]